jgi:stage II sporulation protein D
MEGQMSKKKKRIFGAIVFGIVIVLGLVILFLVKDNSSNHISVATAAKMLSLLEADKNRISQSKDCFNDKKNIWYEKYINYMVEKNYIDKRDINLNFANKKYTYGMFFEYLQKKGIPEADVKEAVDINFDEKKKRDAISKKDFKEIYDYLVVLYGSEEGVHKEELIIAGTPSNMENAGKWQVLTDKGSYGFEGLALDGYIDKKIVVYVRNNEIIQVNLKISDKISYENVWFEKGKNDKIVAYIGNVKREFDVAPLEREFDKVMGDVEIENGYVTSIKIKNDIINGKVLMADNGKVEIQGYGTVELDEKFRAYRTYGIIEEMSVKDILIGYSITDFVVSGNKICGAIISESLVADNIRVMVMTTGFTSIFHERVSVKGTGDYIIRYGDIEEKHSGEDIVDIYSESPYLAYGRISISPVNPEDKVTVLNVQKSYGAPSYRGTIEIAEYEEGLVIVNDVPIETYLWAVVPSEMPDRFGVEALKVQAVCARSYAYKQLLNNSYGRYGAHVDDSVNFQVYNNVMEKDDSKRAVDETYGQVAAFNGTPITTYYYSTSCGHTADASVWGSNPAATPYLTAKEVNSGGKITDLSSEDAFRAFINSSNENDYDYGFGYYRWSVDMSMQELSKSINENLYARYCANNANIKVKRNGVWVSEEIRTIGELLDIEVVTRTKGGGLSTIILRGTEAEILVDNELNIRYLLSPRNNPITLFLGDTTTFYILPSAFCIFDRTENGYKIKGGGYGHGIGMSQNAVSNMVKSGMTYRQILEFYYEGSEIIDVYE